jgi:hypothetical protein
MMSNRLKIPDILINPLYLEVFPDKSSRYLFFEDEGQTLFESIMDKKELIFSIKGQFERDYVIYINRVQINGSVYLEKDRIKTPLADKHLRQMHNKIEIRLSKITRAKVLLRINSEM